MSQRPGSTVTRRKCFHYWRYETAHGWRMKCAHCTIEIHPARDVWEADHLVRHCDNGSHEPPNVRPLCKGCHDEKTYKRDIPEIAKGKRVSDSVYGVKRPSSNLSKREGYKFNWKARRYEKTDA